MFFGGTATTLERCKAFLYHRRILYVFQVIATHNPQDFFCGQEPSDLILTFIFKEDALMETVKQCECGGYVAIVYPYEAKGE